MTTFWQWIYQLMVHSGGCIDLRQSASGVAHQVTYGGNCVQAWLNALWTPGWAWMYQ